MAVRGATLCCPCHHQASARMSLRQSSLIEKVRHQVPWHHHTWEIDVFSGDNAGLILAEIELRDERETFERPPWLGVEVTDQPRYYNSSLAQRPYATWRQATIAAVVAG